MTTNMFLELSDDLAQNIGGGYYFGDPGITNITENLNIFKNLTSRTSVVNKFAGAEADADAFGLNSASQAITYTYTGSLGSQSKATSVSATGSPFVFLY